MNSDLSCSPFPVISVNMIIRTKLDWLSHYMLRHECTYVCLHISSCYRITSRLPITPRAITPHPLQIASNLNWIATTPFRDMEHVDTDRQSKCDEMNLLVRPLALISLLILQALPHVNIDYCWLGYLPWVHVNASWVSRDSAFGLLGIRFNS